MRGLEVYTDEGLEQAMARVLTHARGEVLNVAEVHEFWQFCEEILRRRSHDLHERECCDGSTGPRSTDEGRL
jgi:hypothetical protein